MKTYKVTISDDGTISWYNEKGRLHWEHGPAIIWASGGKEFYMDGKLHREDGPAIEYKNGSKQWWINGERLTEDEFNRRTKKDS